MIESAAQFNSKLGAERTMRLPFLDSQTGKKTLFSIYFYLSKLRFCFLIRRCSKSFQSVYGGSSKASWFERRASIQLSFKKMAKEKKAISSQLYATKI